MAVVFVWMAWLCQPANQAAAQAITRVAAINTIAGDGTAGFGGDGGPAASGALHNPSGLVVDAAGNLYIADTANNRVRKVAFATGTLSTVAGNGTAGYGGDNGSATSAELQSPAGVAVDSSGNLFIADQGNDVIRKVDSAGTITTVAGNNTTGFSGDNGLAIHASLYGPTGVAVDSAGNLYIADAGNNRVRAVAAATGIITTIAGTGTSGYSGDNGPAASATLSAPSAVVTYTPQYSMPGTPAQLYVLDSGNNVVRLVSATGTITTVAGNGTAGYSGDDGPATSATLRAPYGLMVDSLGNVYITDSGNNVVRTVSTAGIISTLAGDGAAGFSGDNGPAAKATLSNPQGIAIDSQGSLYISDQGNERVREVATPSGSVLFPTTLVTATSAAVSVPLQINTEGTTLTGITAPVSQGNKQEYTVTATGCGLNSALAAGTVCNVAVTFSPGYAGQRSVPLQVTTASGSFNFGLTGIGTAPQVALTPGIIAPWAAANTSFQVSEIAGGMAVDSQGNIFAAFNGDGGPYLPAAGVAEFAAGTGVITATPEGGFEGSSAGGVALDSAENLYFAVPQNACIYKVTAAGDSSVVAGMAGYLGNTDGYSGDNGPAVSAALNDPEAVAVDRAGNLYIADTGNNRIRKVNASNGIITTIAGNGNAGFSGDNGPASLAEFDYPAALALDVFGNLYIADIRNNRIREINASTGIITTVAGNGTAGYSGDGGPATSAALNDPSSLAMDAAGNLYFLDELNNAVRVINAAGVIATIAGDGVSGESGDGGLATSAQINAQGIAIDSAGNLYIGGGTISQGGESAVRIVPVTATTLTFAAAQIGSSSTQGVAVTNIGNAPLAFTSPGSGQNPMLSGGFTLDSSSTCPQLSAGSAAASLAPGASCSLLVDFSPTTAASTAGTLSVANNNLNVSAVQTVQLTGGAGQTVATTTTIQVNTPIFGETQVSATLLATSGNLVPAGSVVFTVDGTVQTAIPVDATGVAPLPATVANALAVGSHTIGAVYTSSSLAFGNSNATRIFTVSPAPPTVSIASSAPSLTVAAGSSVADTLTLTSMGGYSGSLQFACSGLPKNASCAFQPASVTVNSTSGPQTTVVTIQTAGMTAEMGPAQPLGQSLPLLPAAAFWSPGWLTMTLARRKRKLPARWYCLVLLLSLLPGMWLMTGCGSGSSAQPVSTGSSPASGAPVTPAGTSTVQITASSAGSVVQSFTLTLTVQ